MQGWSPEQIAHRLKVDFPDDESMRISHEAIYQALYVQGRGALKRELVACLRTGRALRVPRARVAAEGLGARHRRRADQRTARRGRGPRRSRALGRRPAHRPGALRDRHARRAHAPGSRCWSTCPARRATGTSHASKNGPALAGYGAVTMKNALAATMTTLPEQLRRSLTWDRGKELSAHAAFKVETGIPVFFADPHSPWQRGTNENTNGLLRQYFPKGTDLSRWSAEDLEAVAARAQQPAPQDPRLEDPSRSPRRAATLAPTSRCCVDRLSLVNFDHGSPPRARPATAWSARWAGSAPPATTPPWSRSSPCCRRTSSTAARWATRDELRIAIVTWIERTYHRRRRQAALGRLTPIEYETIMTPQTATQAA